MNVVVYTRISTPKFFGWRMCDAVPKDNGALIKVHAVSRNASD